MNKVAFLITISLCSCTVLTFNKSIEGNPRIDFKKGVFVINKVESPSKVTSVLLEVELEKRLRTFTDSIKNINRENLVELGQDTSLYHYPEQLLRILKSYNQYDYLVCLVAHDNSGGKGFGLGDVDFDSRVFIELKFYDLATEKMQCNYLVYAEEGRLEEENRGLVFTKSGDAMLQRCLDKAFRMVAKNSDSVKKSRP